MYALISLLISACFLIYLIPGFVGVVEISKSNSLLSPAISPYLFAGIGATASFFMLVNNLYKKISKREEDIEVIKRDGEKIDLLKLIMAIICLGVFIFLLPILGVEIAVSVLIIGLLITAHERQYTTYILLLVIAILISEFFIYVVNVPIPSSIEIF